MKATEVMKKMIYKGEIDLPTSDAELMQLMERYSVASRMDESVVDVVNSYKELILSVYQYKSQGRDSCYISAIKQAVSSAYYERISESVMAVYGVDLVTRAIQMLVVDEKVAVVGKRIYLLNQSAN